MPYTPIVTPDDLQERLIVGTTREDHWLDFRREPHIRAEDCARDVAQFANASGGALVIGADEDAHVFKGWQSIPNAEEYRRWVDEVLKKHLTPVPRVDPATIQVLSGETVVVLNIPPSLALIARPRDEGFEFPIRTLDSRGYMTLLEVEARLQNKERAMMLRIQQIPAGAKLRLDALVQGISDRDWVVKHVDDHVVTLTNAGQETIIPLTYVEAVYQTTEGNISWVLAASCTMLGVLVAKYNLPEHLRLR